MAALWKESGRERGGGLAVEGRAIMVASMVEGCPSVFPLLCLTQCFRASGLGVRLLAGGERIEGTFEEVGEGRRKGNTCRKEEGNYVREGRGEKVGESERGLRGEVREGGMWRRPI